MACRPLTEHVDDDTKGQAEPERHAQPAHAASLQALAAGGQGKRARVTGKECGLRLASLLPQQHRTF